MQQVLHAVGGARHARDVLAQPLRPPVLDVLRDEPQEALDRDERALEVVRDGVGELLELGVLGLELADELLALALGPLPVGDVEDGAPRPDRPPPPVADHPAVGLEPANRALGIGHPMPDGVAARPALQGGSHGLLRDRSVFLVHLGEIGLGGAGGAAGGHAEDLVGSLGPADGSGADVPVPRRHVRGLEGQAEALLAVAQLGLPIALETIAVQDRHHREARGDDHQGERGGDAAKRGRGHQLQRQQDRGHARRGEEGRAAGRVEDARQQDAGHEIDEVPEVPRAPPARDHAQDHRGEHGQRHGGGRGVATEAVQEPRGDEKEVPVPRRRVAGHHQQARDVDRPRRRGSG